MRFTSVANYPVPAETAYARLADFDALETLAQSYGAEVMATAPGSPDGCGRSWRLAVGIKGIHREVEARIAVVEPPERFSVACSAEGLVADLLVAVAAVHAQKCKVSFTADLGARGLAARLMLQPLRLAQSSLEPKFHARVTAFTRARLGL